MFCNQCGNELKDNQKYCNKCGNHINAGRDHNKNDSASKKKIDLFIPIVIIGIAIVLILVIASYSLIKDTDNYYFNDGNSTEQKEQADKQQTNNTPTKKRGKYKTDIITDNIYRGVSINSIADAKNLIVQDSVNQKQADYPKEIIQIENNIIQKYGITAVNLKEMDVEFAKELENVIEVIWRDYPKAREHLTNLTLTNLTLADRDIIALFMPLFTFGTSNTKTTRPWVIKTQIQLNARYFLNSDKLETVTQANSKSGHFPKNTTRYSSVAHELGHYLSFIALLNHYSTNSILLIEDNQMENSYDIYTDFQNCTFSKQMLDEAYQNYIKDYNNKIDFDNWRGQISQYALAKDGSGKYIYDETIAEAFHDVYLNKENAAIPSKYIVEVLKKYVGR